MYPQGKDGGSEKSLFQRFIKERRLEETHTFSELRYFGNTDKVRLGIDGNRVIQMLQQRVREEEKMALLTYTTPVTLYVEIVDFTTKLAEMEFCEPLLVFNGMQFTPEKHELLRRLPLHEDLSSLENTEKHTILHRMDPTTRAQLEEKTADRFIIDEELEEYIITLFRKELEVLRAPYLAWAQLASFMTRENHYVSEVYGCIELLAFAGVDRVITNLDFKERTFTCVSKDRVLKALHPSVTEADLGSLIALDSHHRLFNDKNQILRVKSFEGLVKTDRDEDSTLGASYLARLSSNNASGVRVPLGYRNIAALNCPVLTMSGECKALCELFGFAPMSNTSRFLGAVLPPTYYFALCLGPLKPILFSTIAQGQIVDRLPTVDSVGFRGAATQLMPLRVQIFHQMMKPFRGMERRQMSWLMLGNAPAHCREALTTPPDLNLDSWNLSTMVEGEPVSFVEVLRHSTRAVSNPQSYTLVSQTKAALLLKSLDFLGYFTHSTYPNVTSCSGFSIYSEALSKCTVPSLSEYAVLVIELMRTGLLNDKPLIVFQTRGEPPELPAGVRFASRLLSIIPLNVLGAWTGPLDVEMAAFGSIARSLARSLRSLTEVMTLLMFHTKETLLPLSEMPAIVDSLPLQMPLEFNSGLLVQYMLLNNSTLEELKEVFPQAAYLATDLETLFYFWNFAMEMINVLFSASEDQIPMTDSHVINEANMHMTSAMMRIKPEYSAMMVH